MGNSRNNPLEIREGVFDLRAIPGDDKFTNAFVMPRTTHFEHVQCPGHLPTNLHVLQHQDRVSDGGDMRIGNGVAPHELLRGVRKESSDLFLFGIAGDTNHKLAEGVMADATGES